MDADFELTLEVVNSDRPPPVFRLAFSSSRERLLLPYPEVTGLQFLNAAEKKVAEWKAHFLSIRPLDEFVLRPSDRIAFDLEVLDNLPPDREHDFTIQLPPGRMSVRYVFGVKANPRRDDSLAKRSRLASLRKIWSGRLESPLVEFDL